MQLGPPERSLAGRRGRNRELSRHSVLGPCRELGVVVDTCVTRALVVHRDGMWGPKGEIRLRWG